MINLKDGAPMGLPSTIDAVESKIIAIPSSGGPCS